MESYKWNCHFHCYFACRKWQYITTLGIKTLSNVIIIKFQQSRNNKILKERTVIEAFYVIKNKTLLLDLMLRYIMTLMFLLCLKNEKRKWKWNAWWMKSASHRFEHLQCIVEVRTKSIWPMFRAGLRWGVGEKSLSGGWWTTCVG